MLFSVKLAAIEIGENTVRLAVVKTGGRRPKVLELLTEAIDVEDPEQRFEATVAAIERLTDGMKHRPAAYVLCLSSLYGIVRPLTIPFRGRRRVAAAVQFELEPYLAFPIDELLLDFKPVAEFGGETQVLAMGVRRQQVEEQTALLEAAGIMPDSVTLDAPVLTGLWAAGRRMTKGLSAVLHAGDSGSNLVITYHGGLAYFRYLPCGAQALREDPAAVAREVQNTLRAFLTKWRGDSDVGTLCVTGVDLGPEEVEALSGALDMPVEAEVILASMRGGAKALGEDFESTPSNTWEGLCGAALSARGGAFALDFTRAERGAEGAMRGVIAHLMFSSCLALLALVCWVAYYQQGIRANRAEIALLEGEIQTLNDEITDLESRGIGVDVDTEIFSAPVTLDLLAEISRKMPEHKVSITSIKFSPPGRSGWLSIEGTAKDVAVFNQVFDDLSKSEYFSIRDEPRKSTQGNLTQFTITAFRPDDKEEASGDEA